MFASDISFFGRQENDFLLLIILSSSQNELSDVNKTYIDIGNELKFKLLKFFKK